MSKHYNFPVFLVLLNIFSHCQGRSLGPQAQGSNPPQYALFWLPGFYNALTLNPNQFPLHVYPIQTRQVASAQTRDDVDDRPVWGNHAQSAQSRPSLNVNPVSNDVAENRNGFLSSSSQRNSNNAQRPGIRRRGNTPIRYTIRDGEVEPYSPPSLEYIINQSPSWKHCLSYCNIKFESFHGELAKTDEKNERLNENPHVAALGYRTNNGQMDWNYCAGALISRDFVLTAAHCVSHNPLGRPSMVRVGEPNYKFEKPQFFSVVAAFVHPGYDHSTAFSKHNIALLKLDRPIKFSKYMRPACLHTPEGTGGSKYGGVESYNWIEHPTLPNWITKDGQMQIEMIDLSPCNLKWNETCSGISDEKKRHGSFEIQNNIEGGSPVHIPHNIFNEYRQCPVVIAAVTTSEKKRDDVDYPRAFTRVNDHVPWIESIVWPKEPEPAQQLTVKEMTRASFKTKNPKKPVEVTTPYTPPKIVRIEPSYHPVILRDREFEPVVPPAEDWVRNSVSIRYCLSYCNMKFIKNGGDHAVVGGVNAALHEFPHMVTLGYNEGTQGKQQIFWNACGGSLISRDFVMTAAHCMTSDSGRPIIVRVGDLDLTSTGDGASPEDIPIQEIIVHPDYNTSVSEYNDIALVRLVRPVTFTRYMRPACLHTGLSFEEFLIPEGSIYSGNVKRGPLTFKPTATGWGRTGFTDFFSDILQKVELDFIDGNTCKRLVGTNRDLPYGLDEETQLCAGVLAGGRDTCPGDSGGPLQVNNTMFHYFRQCPHMIYGITSLGLGAQCADKNTPAIYTRVAHFVPWIESIVWPGET